MTVVSGLKGMHSFEEHGFATLDNTLDEETIAELCEEISKLDVLNPATGYNKRPYGVRDLLNQSPAVSRLAETDMALNLVTRYLGTDARVVRRSILMKRPK